MLTFSRVARMGHAQTTGGGRGLPKKNNVRSHGEEEGLPKYFGKVATWFVYGPYEQFI